MKKIIIMSLILLLTALFQINLSFAVESVKEHDIGDLILPVTNFGQFSNPRGFRYVVWPKDNPNRYIFGGGIWIGAVRARGDTLDTLVTVGYNPMRTAEIEFNKDTATPVYLSTDGQGWPPNIKIISVQDSWTRYDDNKPDTSHIPLGIIVEQHGLSWNATGLKDIVFLDYFIINASSDTLKDMYLGVVSDPDVGNSEDDKIAVDTTRNLGYAWSTKVNDAVGGYVGMDFMKSPVNPSTGQQLGLTALKIFFRPGSAIIDTTKYPPDPNTDVKKYKVLMGKNYITDKFEKYDVAPKAADWRFVQCTGPFTLAPGDTGEVVVAILAASSLANLKAVSDSAQALFENNFIPTSGPVVIPDSFVVYHIAPETSRVEIYAHARDFYDVDSLFATVANFDSTMTFTSKGFTLYSGKISDGHFKGTVDIPTTATTVPDSYYVIFDAKNKFKATTHTVYKNKLGTFYIKAGPYTPVDFRQTSNYLSVDLAWKKDRRDLYPLSYRIYRDENPDGTFSLIGTVSDPSVIYKDKGVTSAVYYYYKIQAIDAKGYTSAISDTIGAYPVLFTNIGLLSGTSYKYTCNGVAFGDVNNDTYLDMYLANYGFNKLYINNGNRTFTDSPACPQVPYSVRNTQAAVFGDYDGDGDLDIFIANAYKTTQAGYKPGFLFRNDNMTFTNVTPPLGGTIAGENQYDKKYTSIWADINNDGFLDLYVVNGDCWSPCVNGEDRDGIYFGDGTGNFTFSQWIPETGGIRAKNRSASLGDIDNDGDLDLCVPLFIEEGEGYSGPPALIYRNDNGIFTDITSSTGIGVRGEREAIGSMFADFNNDGWLDIYISSRALSLPDSSNLLFINDGNPFSPHFTDLTAITGVSNSGRKSRNSLAGDFDNDGYVDIIVVSDSTNTFYHNVIPDSGVFKFDDYTTEADIKVSPVVQASGSIAGDIDNDGDLEMYILDPTSVAGNVLYRNNENTTNYLKVKLIGTRYINNAPGYSNRDGVGAKVKLFPGGAIAAGDTFPYNLLGYREIYNSFGYCSSNPTIAHFGLGKHLESYSTFDIKVIFPSGIDTTFSHISPGTTIYATEPDTTIPTNPKGLSAIPKNRKVILSWNKNNDRDFGAYLLYRDDVLIASVGKSLYPYMLGRKADTTFTDYNLVNGTTYNYKLVVEDFFGHRSLLANTISATPCTDIDLSFDTLYVTLDSLVAGRIDTIFAVIKCTRLITCPAGDNYADSVTVKFYDGLPESGTLIDTKFISRLNVGSSNTLKVYWNTDKAFIGEHTIWAVIDPNDRIGETNKNNNVRQVVVRVVYVGLAKFTATSQNNLVKIEWLTTFEKNTFGFNLYKKFSNESDSKYQKLNTQLISAGKSSYIYLDRNVEGESVYTYMLEEVTFSGMTKVLGYTMVSTPKFIPTSYALYQNYPNPFNPETIIRYAIAGKDVSSNTDYRLPITNYQLLLVKLSIYNITGQLIRTLVHEKQAPGYYNVKWDGYDDKGLLVGSGIYVYRLQVISDKGELFTDTKKMMLLR